MRTNPVLLKMGFDANDRVIIIHADDIGMCQSTLPAFEALIEFGLVSSGSLMVPCPWFAYAAEWCRKRPHVDVGIHLTLTSEWEGYRWGPISTRDPRTGLIDENGYFYRNTKSVCDHADAKAFYAEMKAQLNLAKSMGITPTHIDSHMYVATQARFISDYVRLSIEAGIPALISRHSKVTWEDRERLVSRWEQEGSVIFDHLRLIPMSHSSEDYFIRTKEVFDNMPRGLTCLIIHPAEDTPELRAIVPNWQHRVAEYEIFLTSRVLNYVRKSGIQVIGYRQLQAAMRSGN